MNLPVRNLPGEPIVEPFGSCRPIGKDLRSPRPARRARPGAGSGLTRPRWSPGLHPLSSYGPSATKKDVSNPFSNWVGQQSWVGFSARKSRCERGSACPPAPYIGALSRRSNFLKNPPSKKTLQLQPFPHRLFSESTLQGNRKIYYFARNYLTNLDFLDLFP